MQQTLNFVIGILILLLGIPAGMILAKFTKEELVSGQKWFKLIILVSLIWAIVSLILRNDFLLFTFLFIVIVTGMSLRLRKK